MDKFDAMRVFVRVVEAGSFTKAAQTLHMSRTSVTQLVQRLEAGLRVKLLHRTTRKVNVTEDGAVYYERAARLLGELEELESGLPNAAASPSGQLRVDVPSPLASILLVPALPGFYARYPDIQLDMGASDRIVDLIEDKVDCVVRGGQMSEQWLQARHVADLPLRVYAAPSYLAVHGVPAHPGELADARHRIVCFRGSRAGQGFAYHLRRGAEQVRLEGRHLLAIDDGNAYLAAGLAGLGVLWLPDYMAQRHEEKGELVRLFADWEIAPMPLYVAWPANRRVSKKLRVFIDWVVELLAPYAPQAGRRIP
ncbi:LysR family transcriptional regulator [Massilia sp. KIM]|uniref:LysR family transcriptional regulator n=1 Tax=Massilia sp. KIM TaxID=1955422 RepID=UPI00098FC18E|nr:LysR family transcriptional regulator [Massilia sp. KIM]OON63034.1 LysR family transcriptional regulator [Massilia sp. KIM]